MLIAYNNDIEFRSRWYHIQTEDNGLKDGHITTTVFHSGQILDSKTTSYKDALEGVTNADDQNKIIKEMMIKQHQMFYTKLYEGSYESQMQNFGQRNSSAQLSSVPQKLTTTHANASRLGISSNPNVKKPDILRASQQALGASKLGLKNLSSMTTKSVSGQVPVVRTALSASNPAISSATPATNTNTTPRVFELDKPIAVSKAVQAEIAKNNDKAWCGFEWPKEDLALDALVMSLLNA